MGLVIDSPFIEKILAGEKTWEIRNKTHPNAGRIALCKKGGPIVCTCMIGVAIPLRREEFDSHFNKHRVTPENLAKIYPDGPIYAYPLSGVRRLDPPIKYKHPGGGSWVRLSEEEVQDFERLQKS